MSGGTWHAYRSVAFAVAWRTTHNALMTPNILIPSIAFPLFFFTAFVGGLSQLSNLPGFEFPAGYTAFQFVFVLLQSAAFGGVFTGFGIARDFEYGFSRRLMLAAPHRSAILVGYGMAAIARWAVTAAVLYSRGAPARDGRARQRRRGRGHVHLAPSLTIWRARLGGGHRDASAASGRPH